MCKIFNCVERFCILSRYGSDSTFPIDCTNVQESIKVLKRVGLISEEFPSEDIWNSDPVISLRV